MADHEYANWYEEPKTPANLNLVLLGRLYVEHYGNIYEYIQTEEGGRRNHRVLLSDVNNGDPLYTSWYEILYSPAFSIMRKEV